MLESGKVIKKKVLEMRQDPDLKPNSQKTLFCIL